MHSQAKQTDICQTCIHAAHCAHHKQCQSQGKVIFYCEDFDDKPVLSVVQGEVDDDRQQHSNPSKTGIAYIKGRMKGLCLNCEKRESCRYPTRDGGVWHCEEYC